MGFNSGFKGLSTQQKRVHIIIAETERR